MCDVNLQPVRRKQCGDPIRPLDQHNPGGPRVIPAGVKNLVRRLHPVTVKMPHGRRQRFINLRQRKGRTGHRATPAARAQECPRERCFAAAEIARQRHHIARQRQRRQLAGQSCGCAEGGKINPNHPAVCLPVSSASRKTIIASGKRCFAVKACILVQPGASVAEMVVSQEL